MSADIPVTSEKYCNCVYKGVMGSHMPDCPANEEAPPTSKTVDRGELWSFLRSVLSQGRDIWLDHLRTDYEVYSARLDAAAGERVDALLAKLQPPETSGKPLHDEECENCGAPWSVHLTNKLICPDAAVANVYRFRQKGSPEETSPGLCCPSCSRPLNQHKISTSQKYFLRVDCPPVETPLMTAATPVNLCSACGGHQSTHNDARACKACGGTGRAQETACHHLPGQAEWCPKCKPEKATAPLKCKCGRDLVPYAGCPVCDVPAELKGEASL